LGLLVLKIPLKGQKYLNSPVILEELLQKYQIQIGMGLIGLILVGAGIIFFRQQSFSLGGQSSPSIEIISSQAQSKTSLIWVDLEGAVEKPGVYQLAGQSRLNDLLIRAGGLSAAADRAWVAKNINLAQKLVDGVKIYIPSRREGQSRSVGASAKIANRINLNTASAAQLDSLWGIGEKRAQNIIAHRPYQTIEELTTKAGIPGNILERIKDKITIY